MPLLWSTFLCLASTNHVEAAGLMEHEQVSRGAYEG